MVVTIDGPSGVGKSTVGRLLAEGLGIAFLDTGALYRTVALAAKWDNVAIKDEAVVEAWLTRIELTVRLEGSRFAVFLEDREVEPFIRNEQIGSLASQMSALESVRRFLLKTQRDVSSQGDLVTEGRDMGTVVFPGAEAKFFLTATNEERARRRLRDLLPSQPEMTLEEVLKDMRLRDKRDTNRKLSPLRPAQGALVVDTTELGQDEVVTVLMKHVRAIQPNNGSSKQTLS